MTAFQEVFPHLEIAHLQSTDNGKESFARFVSTYAETILGYGDMNVVIEGGILSLEQARNLFDPKVFKIVVLGCPNATPRQWFDAVRKNDTDKEPTFYFTNEKLLEKAQHNIDRSKQMFAECKKHGIETLDTFSNRGEVFSDFVNKTKFSQRPGTTSERKIGLENYINQHVNK